MDYQTLEALVAPGWALREGWSCGPAAEGTFWLTAPTYEEVVWRTWCHLFGHYTRQDDMVFVWPLRPSDWQERIAQARRVWEAAQFEGKVALS